MLTLFPQLDVKAAPKKTTCERKERPRNFSAETVNGETARVPKSTLIRTEISVATALELPNKSLFIILCTGLLSSH